MIHSIDKLLFAGLLFLSILGVACKNDLAAIERVIKPEELNQELIQNFETLYSDSAVVRVRIQGPVMIRHLDEKDPRQEFPEGVKVEFFSPNQRITSRLTSKYAVRMENDGKIIVRDSVVWESVNNEKLETTELVWEEQEKRVHTNKFVTIRRPDEIIYGYGFESDQDFSRSRIKAIEGKIKVDQLQDEPAQ
jgi:LPS export ABC transporter protein LptC